MKKILPLFFLLFSAKGYNQQVMTPIEGARRYPGHVLVLLADSTLAFTATLNGVKQNNVPLTQVRLVEIYRSVITLRLDFEDPNITPITVENLRLNEADANKSIWWFSVYKIKLTAEGAELVMLNKGPWFPNMPFRGKRFENEPYTGLSPRERTYPRAEEKKSNAKPLPVPPKPKKPIGPVKKER